MFLESCSELSATEMWRDLWKMKLIEDNFQTIYISHRLTPSKAHLTMKGRNIPFVNYAKFLGVILHKRITWKVHTVPRFAHGLQPSVSTRLYKNLCRHQEEVIRNHENEYVRRIGQGEARQRKYKGLNLGGDQAYDRSSD
jgi:hypothetical protein